MSTENKKSSFDKNSADNIHTKHVNKLAGQFAGWLDGSGRDSDIVISSRVRLARNLSSFNFPAKASSDILQNILESVEVSIAKVAELCESTFICINELAEQDRLILMERRLISPEMAQQHLPCGIVVGKDEMTSIMINEEDHLRIQGFESGLEIDRAWHILSRIDDEFSELFEYAYDDHFGYLTSCPTNTGTGLRVSLFIHLPGLAMSDRLESVVNNLFTEEITLRGFYGEGTEALGNIFQLSNQLTLGRTETGIIERLKNVTEKLIEIEREEREHLKEFKSVELEDRIGRSYGAVKYAKILSAMEAINIISNLMLGVDLKYIENIERKMLNELLVEIQPAHVRKYYGESGTAHDRDYLRANFLRNKLDL